MLEKGVRILDRVIRIVALIGGIALIITTVLCVADVIMRNTVHVSLLGYYEFTQYVLIPITIFPAFAYAYRANVFPRITALTDKMGNFAKVWEVTSVVIELIIYGLLLYYGAKYAMQNTLAGRGLQIVGKNIPIYLVYWISPISFLLIELQLILIRIPELLGKDVPKWTY